MRRNRGLWARCQATAYYLLLSLASLPFVAPLLWMVATAFKTPGQIYGAPLQWAPNPVTFDNFKQAWDLLDFPTFIRNSLWITVLSLFGTLLSSSLVGYAFAMLPARGKNLIFSLLLATMMVPGAVTLLPLFVLFSKLQWVNTYLPIIVPHFFANPFYVFLFRQFFCGLPGDLFEHAEIDGCHPLTAFWWIALPHSGPVIVTVAIFAFINSWNDFLSPLIYLSSMSKFTLSLGLAMFHGLFYTQLEYLMPMSLVALAPVLLIFCLAQRYFVAGIATTGIDG